MHVWKVITADGVEVMAVPGGLLYREYAFDQNSGATVGVALCFVRCGPLAVREVMGKEEELT
jgi:hypothetical protein